MTAHPFDLTGKVALVTGAYRGLGYAMVQGLAEAGALVVLNGRREELVAAAAKQLVDCGLNVATSVFDVTDGAAVRVGIAASEARHGRLDVSSTTPASSAATRWSTSSRKTGMPSSRPT
jgi:gluconate 5-dehydrogenase